MLILFVYQTCKLRVISQFSYILVYGKILILIINNLEKK